MKSISNVIEFLYREEILDFEEECRQHLQFGLIQQLEQEIDSPFSDSEESMFLMKVLGEE